MPHLGPRSKPVRWTVLGGFVLFVVTTALVAYSASNARRRGGPVQPSPIAALSPSESSRSYPELVLIYVGRASCSWCNQPELRTAMLTIRDMLEKRARKSNHTLRVIGIGVDHHAKASLSHLAKLGDFDEIAAGYGWVNFAARRFVLGDLAGPPATPQLIVLTREIRAPIVSLRALPEVANERLIARKVGLHEILAWVEHEVPLPRLSSDALSLNTKHQ